MVVHIRGRAQLTQGFVDCGVVVYGHRLNDIARDSGDGLDLVNASGAGRGPVKRGLVGQQVVEIVELNLLLRLAVSRGGSLDELAERFVGGAANLSFRVECTLDVAVFEYMISNSVTALAKSPPFV